MRDFGEILPPEKTRRWKPWTIAFLVILTSPLWLAACLLGYAILVVIYAFSTDAASDGSSLVPASLHAKSIYHYSDEGFPGGGGGCSYDLYALPHNVSQEIQRSGLSYFRNLPQSKAASASNPYGPWRATPAPPSPPTGEMSRKVDLSYARFIHLRGCEQKDVSKIENIIGRDDPLTLPGSFYAVSENQEGLIIVAPEKNLVIFAYFG